MSVPDVGNAGKRATFMVFGSFVLIPVFTMLYFMQANLVLPIALLGLSFSLIPAVMWPSVAYMVEAKNLGCAYALMTLIQQAGVGGASLSIGWLNSANQASLDNPEGYMPMVLFLSVLSLLGFIFSLWLRKVETGVNHNGLEKSTFRHTK